MNDDSIDRYMGYNSESDKKEDNASEFSFNSEDMEDDEHDVELLITNKNFQDYRSI